MNYPENLEVKLGFNKLRQELVNYSDTLWAKEHAQQFEFLSNRDQITTLLAETREFTQIQEFEKGFEWFAPNDLREALKRASVPGLYLTQESFIDIRNNYKAVNQLLTFFSKTKDEQYPNLKARLSGVKVFPYILDKIDQVFNKHGAIKDSASKELSNIRSKISQKTQGVSKRIHKLVDQARSEGWVEQDASPTLREGRLVIPVPVTHKRRINGLIHDESATGKTVYIEPVELVELNNEIRALEMAENREIIKILISLTEAIRPYFEEILDWPRIIGVMDFIRAKARLCKNWDGVEINLSDDKLLEWKSARHPLMIMSFRKDGRKVVSQDIVLDPNNRILLISGPNAGGKSVCLKTVGLVQYMIQCGLLPPVGEGSVSPVFNDLFIDIGDDQSLENDLSTYSSHLLSMKYFIKNAGSQTLLLIDEFGTGTEPQLGAAISQAILGELNSSGAFGVITTHYSNLKHFAASTKGIINGAMLYDSQNMKPLFRLEIGKPGSSFAFEIAQQIGLPSTILEQAKEQVGSDYIKFDKHLREISRDKRYWERKRASIRQQEKQLEKLLDDYHKRVAGFEKDKKQKLKEVQSESELLLSQINKRIENTIQAIKAAQAEKEKAKEERKRIQDFADETRKKIKQKSTESDLEVVKLQKDQERIKDKFLGKEQNSYQDDENEVSVDSSKSSVLLPGLKVQLVNQNVFGEILKVNRKSVLVSIGDIMTTVAHDQVLIISEGHYKKSTKKSVQKTTGSSWQEMEERRMNFSANVDIRGARADEAIRMIQDLVDDSIMLENKYLRILHGKGNGVLRDVIRQYLASVDIVKSIKDEDIRFGGSGITLVELDY